MNVALYHRCSTLDQNPTLARDELHAAAKMRGLTIALDIEETGSGARNDRPGLQRIMEAARRGAIDIVLCWKLDRFGRSALDLLANIRALQEHGVRFIATSQGIDLKPGTDAISNLLVTLLAGVAEFERALIQERTRLGLDRARQKGTKLGRPTRGPDPREVARLRSQGASWSAISAALRCTTSSARRAFQRHAETGRVQDSGKMGDSTSVVVDSASPRTRRKPARRSPR
jgi:DNA invertase Pin-like site-specific DNA recombinase